jgi:uncharacterized protein (DUF58 family)
MMPTRRLAAYLALGAIFWVAAALVPAYALAAWLYLAALLAVAGVDAFLMARPGEFELSRECEERLNLGVPNRVTLRARRAASTSTSGRALSLTVRDEAPGEWPLRFPDADSLDASASSSWVEGAPLRVPQVRIDLEQDDEASAFYEVVPTRRGEWEFGDLHGRYDSALGLWQRQFKRPAPLKPSVYPDVTAVRRFEIQLRNGRSLAQGAHRMRLRGGASEFESLRDYTPGDEWKSINWKASSRRGKLIATNYEIERDQTLILALDCGRMMTSLAHTRHARKRLASSSPSTSIHADTAVVKEELEEIALSKLDCAINAAVLLAHVAASSGDAVGLLLFDDGVKAWVPPRKGRAHTGAIIDALAHVQPRLVEPDYALAYAHLQSRKVRRAQVVTFTDVIDPLASQELIAASANLRRSHRALCVAILNRDVSEMAAQFPQEMDELYAKAMAQRLEWQRSATFETLRQNGVGVLDTDAANLSVATVNRYLAFKARSTW